jgi:hypothetical protein
MISRTIVVLVAVCSLLGCVEDMDRTGGPGWVRPDGSHIDFQKDTDECRRAATLRPVTGPGPAGRAAEVRHYYDDCMIARGWTFDPRVSKDRMADIVSCKLPDVEQVQRISARDCNNRYGKIL